MASAKQPDAQCHHSGKYEISTDGGPVPDLPYPSRLGFLHTTECGTEIRYIDLNKKLCRSCCDSLVIDGKYLVWSVLAGTSAANVAATVAALPPGDGHFPPILQAGSELKNTSHNAVLSIPDIPGAKEAWQWLEKQAKPFYIDQLHMVVSRGMSPLARRRAAKDSAVALRYGQVFNFDALQSYSTTSTIQVTLDTPDTHHMGDPASSVKKKSTSKKDPAKKKSDETSKKEEKEKEKDKKDKWEKNEKKVKKEKTEKKETKEKKEEREKQAAQGAQAAEIITSSATHSTKTRVSELSSVRQESITSDSKVCNEPSKTLSTSSLDVLGPTLGPPSTPNFATASLPSTPNLGGTPSASKIVSDRDAASVDVNATQVVTTTVKTLSRSWGWSEPFEFTTSHRRVPALSDYERVAESRAPSHSTANSLDNFLREHLQLDAPRKLLGPGEAESISHKAAAGASSSMLKDSTVLQHSESKVSRTKSHDKVSSAKKASKDSDAKSKSKKSTHDSLHSDASGIAKAAKLQKTKTENTEKSTGSKKTDHLDLTHSSKLARNTTSEQSKQQVRKDASSTSSHRADKKAVSSDLSTHRTKSETRTKEVHESSIKVKKTSDQPGSLTGVFKAGMNCLENKLHEATEKKHKKDKHQEEKPSKPDSKPHGPPHHETDDHPEHGDTEATAQSGAHPLQPGQKPPGQPEQESQEHSEGNGPNPSTHTGVNPPQSNDPGLPDSDSPSNVPAQAAHPDQTGPPIQTTTSAQTEPPAPTATNDFTQPGQSAGTDGMAGPGFSAQSNLSQQASAQGGSDLDPSTQLPSQAGGGPVPYQPVNLFGNAAASSTAVAGEAPVQDGTGQQYAVPSDQGATTSPTPPTGLGIVGPDNQPMKLPDSSGANQLAIDSPAEARPLPTQSDARLKSEGPFGGDGSGGSTSARPTQGNMQSSDLTSSVPRPENSDTMGTSGISIPQAPAAQVLPGAVDATTGLKPSDSTANNQSQARKEPSHYSPFKSTGTGPGTDVGHYDNTMAQDPKGAGGKKPGGHIVHDKPGNGSATTQPKRKLEHTPRRPHAVNGGKSRPSGGVAAGVVAGVAMGAAAVAIAGQADVDERSDSDSDNDTTHAGGYNDDDETSSERNDDAEAASDGNDSSPDEPEDSSDDEANNDDGEGQDESESDGDEDQGFGTYDPGSDDDSGPEHDDASDVDESDNQDEGEDASMGINSSEGEDSDEASDDEEEEAENTESESETSDNGSDNSDNDSPAQDSSESEDNSDGENDESSSGGEDNDSGQEDDEEATEQDYSSNEGGSDNDDDEASDDFSDED